MHKQKGLNTTTLPAWEYGLKRLAYRVVFDHAVNKSIKIITPSNAVKRELIARYRLNQEKVSVTYEGVDING